MHANCLTPKPLGVIFYNTQWLSLICLHTVVEVKFDVEIRLVLSGVYKQWTGLLEWWNTGMVDWIVFNFHF